MINIYEVLDITLRSLLITSGALLLCSSWSIPIAVTVALKEFRGKWIILNSFSSLVGIPTVTIGLILYIIFSRRGPLGSLDLLFTPWSMMVGQAILLTPYLITFLSNSLMALGKDIKELALILGATELQANWKVIRESSSILLSSLASTFSRGIGELGVALMVGGNLEGYTRVLTTAIALETIKGEFELSLTLSLILLLITLGMNFIINFKGFKRI